MRFLILSLVMLHTSLFARTNVSVTGFSCAEVKRTKWVILVPYGTNWGPDNTSDEKRIYTECAIYNASAVTQHLRITSYKRNGAVPDTVTAPGATPELNVDQVVLQQNESIFVVWPNRNIASGPEVPRAAKFEVCQDDGFLIGSCTIYFRNRLGSRPQNHHGRASMNSVPINGGEPF